MGTAAECLRGRSRELRSLADAIERTPLLALERHAGPDTWRCRAADECRSELARDQHQLHLAADDLRMTAWRFEREADELDAQALLATPR